MFQEKRIAAVRKTTKWAITFNDKLRLILVNCEAHVQRERRGGVWSAFRDLPDTAAARD